MSPIFIIAEIGINHDGSFEAARRLIDSAADAGAHAVKFQYRNLDNAYADDANEIGDEILRTEIRRNFLSPAQIIDLTAHAHVRAIQAGISFFDTADIADFGEHAARFDFFKIPSVELGNGQLIDALISTGKPVYLSTGCHTEVEIDAALGRLLRGDWMPLHCVSNYPVSLSNAKLGYLSHLSRKWQRPFGYSSHDEHWEVCLLAMQLGATVIERHITHDKTAAGLDHSTSSTPDEFRRLALFAANFDLILAGDGPRTPNQGEMLNLQNLGRSYYVRQTVAAGEAVTRDNTILRSPRVGLGRLDMESNFGRRARRALQPGDVLNRSVFDASPELPASAIDFARRKRLSLPVRLHDMDAMQRKFPVGAFEFHLSFGEVLSGPDASACDADNQYSIHLPDYINPVQLMDPFADSPEQAKLSREILQKTAHFANALQARTGRPVPVVGSFSQVHGSLERFHTDHAALLDTFRRDGVEILPQWLPPIAWYFGGSVRLDAMNNARDVELLLQHGVPICMDVCHLCMGDSVFKFDARRVIDALAPQIGHIHLADANGVDGEGIAFGEGDPANMKAIERAMALDGMKVIEVWQGHLDDGAGFSRALLKLAELFDDQHQ